MTRTYTLKRRAEQQAQTRRRIVEAAVELHGTLGPARTTLTMVAERAGVQRHTLYAHFPDERSLLMACSGLHFERHTPPDATPWRAINDRPARLRVGLEAIYGYYEENAQMTALVRRDAELHPVVREVSALRFGPYMASYQEVLGASLTAPQGAMLTLALNFSTWRSLVLDSGLSREQAVMLMVQAIEGAGAA